VVLPLLLVTTLGLVDMGRAAQVAVELENAATVGASYGARTKDFATDTAGIEHAVLTDFDSKADASGVTVVSKQSCECSDGSSVACDKTCGGRTPLMYVQVQVSKQFNTLLKYPGIDSTIDLARKVELRVR
jgi:Flp pilus assembly protein TadG